MTDVIVIGTGLFGSVVAASLRRRGHNVSTVDDLREGSGSRPAACLMKMSWLSGLGRDVYEPALRELDDLYGLRDVRFRVGPASATVHWVPPSLILGRPDRVATVREVAQEQGGWAVHCIDAGGSEIVLHASSVVVAAGVWTGSLVRLSREIKAMSGVAFLWPDHTISDPFISPWAPYRQLVGFNRGDGAWVGDGTSILSKNWTVGHVARSEARCVGAMTSRVVAGSLPAPRRIYGMRPYVDLKPCLLEEPAPGLWVATGGAKNGTLAAGWCGHMIAEKMS